VTKGRGGGFSLIGACGRGGVAWGPREAGGEQILAENKGGRGLHLKKTQPFDRRHQIGREKKRGAGLRDGSRRT